MSRATRDPTPRGPRADAVRNRQRVVDAAFRLFAARGPEVSMREVATAAGVGPGTIYRHFPDKDSLLAGVVEERLRGLAQATREAMASQSPWDAFASTMRLMARMMTEDRAFAGAVGAARVDASGDEIDPSDARARRDRARADLDEALGELAATARDAGELRPDVGPMELGALLAGVDFLARVGDHAAPGSSLGHAAPWETYLDVALDGLHASSAGARSRG